MARVDYFNDPNAPKANSLDLRHLDRVSALCLIQRGWVVEQQHRAVATRYDKRRYVYLGTAAAATLVIWLRT